MFGVGYWVRLSAVMTGCGRIHSLGTCLPDRIIVAAMTAVRHWYTGYVGAIAVSLFFCHKARKSCWSSAVIGATGFAPSWDASATPTLRPPAASQTASSL